VAEGAVCRQRLIEHRYCIEHTFDCQEGILRLIAGQSAHDKGPGRVSRDRGLVRLHRDSDSAGDRLEVLMEDLLLAELLQRLDRIDGRDEVDCEMPPDSVAASEGSSGKAEQGRHSNRVSEDHPGERERDVLHQVKALPVDRLVERRVLVVWHGLAHQQQTHDDDAAEEHAVADQVKELCPEYCVTARRQSITPNRGPWRQPGFVERVQEPVPQLGNMFRKMQNLESDSSDGHIGDRFERAGANGPAEHGYLPFVSPTFPLSTTISAEICPLGPLSLVA